MNKILKGGIIGAVKITKISVGKKNPDRIILTTDRGYLVLL